MFIVKTDENLFNRFNLLALSIKHLSYLFQNPNAKITSEELKEWYEIVTIIEQDFKSLIDEAKRRIVHVKEE